MILYLFVYLFIFPTFLSDPYELCKALLEQTFLYIYKICHIRLVPNVLLLAKVGNHLLSLGPNLLTYIHTYKACRGGNCVVSSSLSHVSKCNWIGSCFQGMGERRRRRRRSSMMSKKVSYQPSSSTSFGPLLYNPKRKGLFINHRQQVSKKASSLPLRNELGCVCVCGCALLTSCG